MTSRPLGTLFLWAVVALSLASCASPTEGSNVDETLTVEQAKSIAQATETELATFVPRDLVASVDQRSSGVLLRCSTEGTFQWTGSTTVRIVAGERVDAEAIASSIVSAYDGRESMTAAVERTSDGEPRAHVAGPAGAGYLVSEDPDRTGVRIASFSPCFQLPPDMSPGDRY